MVEPRSGMSGKSTLGWALVAVEHGASHRPAFDRRILSCAGVCRTVRWVMDQPATSFRSYLQHEFARRSRANPKYSLRAFARRLGLDHSTLSQVLRGKRQLPPRRFSAVGVKLGLTPAQVEALRRADGVAGQAEAVERRAFVLLARDCAAMVREPLHLAVLELLGAPGFRADSRWLGEALGVSTDEVNVALTRLVRLGILRMEARGRWIDATTAAATALREYTRAALARAAADMVMRREDATETLRFTVAAEQTDQVRAALARLAARFAAPSGRTRDALNIEVTVQRCGREIGGQKRRDKP
jgi:transcriptional regulator with XRE-family HTH domain